MVVKSHCKDSEQDGLRNSPFTSVLNFLHLFIFFWISASIKAITCLVQFCVFLFDAHVHERKKCFHVPCCSEMIPCALATFEHRVKPGDLGGGRRIFRCAIPARAAACV